MMTLNDNEKNFQKKLQKDTEIPVIVQIGRASCRERV